MAPPPRGPAAQSDLARALRPPALSNRTLAAYRVGTRLAAHVPRPLLDGASRLAGAAFAMRDTPQRRMLARHLARATGRPATPGQLRRAFGSYARYYGEALRLPSVGAGELARDFRVEGIEHLDDAIAAGTGVVIALPHLGGWEYAAHWLTSTRHVPVTAVVERIEPPELFEWFRDFRASLGMHVVPLGPEAGPAVLRALRENQVVCLLCDRDLVGDGVEVEFFGERTTLPAGPVTVAMRTGAPLVPTAIYFQERGVHLAVLRPPLVLDRQGSLREDIARHTQALAHELEVLIRRAPEQWHLLQPNWPSDRT